MFPYSATLIDLSAYLHNFVFKHEIIKVQLSYFFSKKRKEKGSAELVLVSPMVDKLLSYTFAFLDLASLGSSLKASSLKEK